MLKYKVFGNKLWDFMVDQVVIVDFKNYVFFM